LELRFGNIAYKEVFQRFSHRFQQRKHAFVETFDSVFHGQSGHVSRDFALLCGISTNFNAFFPRNVEKSVESVEKQTKANLLQFWEMRDEPT
jgi:hypothetical protein